MYKPYKRNGHPAALPFRENERIRLITVFFHDKPTEERNLCCLSGMLAYF